uniref:Uncharacterized protein n=1 Tax=Rhodopseudomonas palustris (strain BisA53) TaxID=316055 RepID=Q07I82_RHOP5
MPRAALAAWCAADPGPLRNAASAKVPVLRSGMKNAAPRPGHREIHRVEALRRGINFRSHTRSLRRASAQASVRRRRALAL